MKKIIKILTVSLTIVLIAIFSMIAYAETQIETEYYITDINNLSVNCKLPLKYDTVYKKTSSVGVNNADKVNYKIDVKLFGVIPVSKTNVQISDEKIVDVLGTPFGIKIYTDGVLVVSLNSFKGENGECCPAEAAGIKAGDYIISINGAYVYSNSDVQKIVTANKDGALNIVYSRNGKSRTTIAYPNISENDNSYHLGVWVRDSSAGIGTLTFYDRESNTVAGLGHGICDEDTGELMSVNMGSIVPAEILSIEKSGKGTAGELCGRFINNEYTNAITNSETGIYGRSVNKYTSYATMPLANYGEIKEGTAYVLTTIDGTESALYECKISDINSKKNTKNFVVEITDKNLLKETGGILQGMSGSPIIQNGKLIGAVTHVFVDECQKGYGIFAENMLETAENMLNKAS